MNGINPEAIEVVNIIGAGQLGRMMAPEFLALGHHVRVLDQNGPHSPAGQIPGVEHIEGSIKDPQAIMDFVHATPKKSSVTTIEIEHFSGDTYAALEEEGYVMRPSGEHIVSIQDKLIQKNRLHGRRLPVAQYMGLDGEQDYRAALRDLGPDLIVKARTGGYDGRGNKDAKPGMTWHDMQAAFTPKEGGPIPKLYAEQRIDFVRELSFVAARGVDGIVVPYPVVHTVHKRHICHEVSVPVDIDPRVMAAAEEIGHEIFKLFPIVGVMVAEMFEATDDRVYVNELAPRVHNSGHWTDLGAETSQFKQHALAITGRPLGSTAMRAPGAAMVNLLGSGVGDWPAGLVSHDLHDARIVTYGKGLRPERKCGHVSAIGNSASEALDRARRIAGNLVDTYKL